MRQLHLFYEMGHECGFRYAYWKDIGRFLPL